MKKKEKLYAGGRVIEVIVNATLGSAEDMSEDTHVTDGSSSWSDGTIYIPKVDDATLSHEVGHIMARIRGVYLSEYQIPVFEELFTVLRDPRNTWLLDYYEG